MQLFIKTPGGQTITLDVEGSDTLDNVKAVLRSKLPEKKVKREWLELRTVEGVRLLDGDLTVWDYGLSDGTTLNLTVRVEGGKGMQGVHCQSCSSHALHRIAGARQGRRHQAHPHGDGPPMARAGHVAEGHRRGTHQEGTGLWFARGGMVSIWVCPFLDIIHCMFRYCVRC